MIAESIWALSLTSLLVFMFVVSNILHARGIPFYVTRKVAHFGAGLAILPFPLVFENVMYPVLLPALFLITLVLSHNKETFHGFAKKGRWSELYFALAAVISMSTTWWYNPFLATLPILLVAFGDGITGVVRFLRYNREVKGAWGSVAMLVVCASISVAFIGVWGLVVAGAATLAERQPWIDDNIAIPVVALAVSFIVI